MAKKRSKPRKLSPLEEHLERTRGFPIPVLPGEAPEQARVDVAKKLHDWMERERKKRLT